MLRNIGYWIFFFINCEFIYEHKMYKYAMPVRSNIIFVLRYDLVSVYNVSIFEPLFYLLNDY
jgi:hypothetical protein